MYQLSHMLTDQKSVIHGLQEISLIDKGTRVHVFFLIRPVRSTECGYVRPQWLCPHQLIIVLYEHTLHYVYYAMHYTRVRSGFMPELDLILLYQRTLRSCLHNSQLLLKK